MESITCNLLHPRACFLQPRSTPEPHTDHLKLHICLIKPSLYDDDGYVIRFRRGVLPSNTLGCLNGLVHGLPEIIPGLEVSTSVIDEIVDRVDCEALCREARDRTGLTLFFLCGVQTNMLPRAIDIARQLRASGFEVLLGGFHVSGVISVFEEPDRDMQVLLDMGVTLVAGEVEDTLAQVVNDCIENRGLPLYNFLNAKPDLSGGHLPLVDPSYLQKFALRSFSTLDLGRGCPYRCSFCTIINVHGNQMRPRDLTVLERRLVDNYDRLGISYYFFTDDNMARHPACETVFELLTRLREGGRHITFMMQVDVLAHHGGFAERAAAAGCTQVFIGMESLNALNLKAVGKRQNRVEDFRGMIATWKAQGIMTHVGYIIGFPHDTPESVRTDVRMLCDEIDVDLASFFMLTPLPGSRDHEALVRSGIPMDEDHNRFDSFHPVTDHPQMSRADWQSAYDFAWQYFYSARSMNRKLGALRGERLRDMWGSYLWYAYAREVQRLHPMVCGFGRVRSRAERRASLSTESLPVYAMRRLADGLRGLVRWCQLAIKMGVLYGLHLRHMRDRSTDGLRQRAVHAPANPKQRAGHRPISSKRRASARTPTPGPGVAREVRR